jgi:putative transposase
MQQQARHFSLMIAGNTGRPSYLIHYRDGAFLPFDEGLRPTGIKVIKTPLQSPMCNAHAERFVRETRETLDNLILLGEWRSRHVLKRIEHHHNRQRPHQGLDNVVPPGFEYPDHPAPLGTVRCDAALGGLPNHHYAERIAA